MRKNFYKLWLWTEHAADRHGLYWPFPRFYSWLCRRLTRKARQLTVALDRTNESMANAAKAFNEFHRAWIESNPNSIPD